MLKIIFYLILSYLCGAIPFGYIIAKVFKNIDIRKQGSGNTGATNVYRTISKPLGVLTLILDVLKGFIPVYFVIHNFSFKNILDKSRASMKYDPITVAPITESSAIAKT